MNERGGSGNARAAEAGVGEREVRRLMRSAGPRPLAPPGDLAAIRAAARSEWDRMVAAQESRRGAPGRLPLALAAGLLVALVGAWWWSLRPGAGAGPRPLASVEAISGAGSGLAAGDPVVVGTRLATPAVAGASLAVRLAGGESLRLDRDSAVRLAAPRRFELERGAVYVDSGAAGSGALEILTPLGAVRDVGTQFEVRIVDETPGLTVRVREGRVSWRDRRDSIEVAAGEQLTVGEDGGAERTPLAAWDAVWSWAAAAGPALDIEGRSLAEYLDWVERETGLTVTWADGDLRDLARAVVLHGDIEGLTPVESLLAILPGSSLGYRVEGGALRIERP